MKRTDRMFGIVVDLQSRRIQRAADLAARYETSVRTIYRDVMALCEAGIPVVSLPGQGYALPRDFFLPPLSLTLEEAAAILLGVDYVAQTLDPVQRAAAVTAGKKIEAVVPAALQEALIEARRALRLIGATPSDADLERLQVLKAAISERRVLMARYRGQRTDDAAGTGQQPRRIAPYGLAQMRGAWYLIGHSFERDAMRRFRLSRLDDVTVTAESFTLPVDFVIQPPPVEQDLPLLVRVTFASGVLGLMQERLRSFDATIEPYGSNFIAAFRAHTEASLVASILSWGGAVRVLEPASLHRRIVAQARSILENATDTQLSVE